MHETVLIRNLVQKIQQVAEAEGGRPVVRISVWLGALSHLTGSHFLEHYREDAKGTLGEGAEVFIEVSKDVHDPRARDLVLKSIEVAEPEDHQA
jgi:hydrogenase nickel incorporation protein HypA/HybF